MNKLPAVFLILILVVCSATALAGVDWSGDTITADGYGNPPKNSVNPAQSNILARRSAVADGYNNLIEQIAAVNIDSRTTVKAVMSANAPVKTGVDSLAKNAKVVKENWTPEGVYHVVLQTKLFGIGSLAARVIPGSGIGGGSRPAMFILPRTKTAIGSCTGIVVDCRGMGLDRVMAPAIYDETGRSIYSARYITDDQLINQGLCDYESQDAINMPNFRAGGKPVIVKATKLKNSNRDVVVRVADAELLLNINVEYGVLKNTKVVFLTE